MRTNVSKWLGDRDEPDGRVVGTLRGMSGSSGWMCRRCTAQLPGAPVTQIRKWRAPLSIMPHTVGTTLPGAWPGRWTHFSMASIVFSRRSPDPVGQLAWDPGARPPSPHIPCPLPHHFQSGQVEWLLFPYSISCPAVIISTYLELCPPLNILPLGPTPLCCPPALHSSPAQLTSTVGPQAGTEGWNPWCV